jgi:hypothetical protein
LEFTRKPKFEELKENAIAQINIEITEDDSYKCYLNCLKELPKHQCSLIIRYYSYTKESKIRIRKKLESELNLTSLSLRARIFRIKKNLQMCLQKCKK